MPGSGNVPQHNRRLLRSLWLKSVLGLSVVVMLGVSPVRAAEPESKYNDAYGQAIENLINSLNGVGPEYRGRSEALNDPVAKYVLMLGRGLSDQAAALVPQVCTEWRAMSPRTAFTGEFSIAGVNVSLDKLCGIEKK